MLFGVLFIAAACVLGFLLAVFIDQKVRGEGVLRTVFLYPYAMSFVATGLVWQWMLNPELGIQSRAAQLGLSGLHVRLDRAPGHGHLHDRRSPRSGRPPGLVMAILLAGLRGIDDELWKAARIDGIPRWRVLPEHRAAACSGRRSRTAFVLLCGVGRQAVRRGGRDDQGGPGNASEVPAKFIMDNLFGRANIGLASAASTVMLLTVVGGARAVVLRTQSRARRGSEARR